MLKKVLLIAMKLTSQKETSEVSLLLTNDQEIQELNKLYRNVDSPTDVLAFSQTENGIEFPLLDGKIEYLLGDIIISVETAQRQAAAFGHSLEQELIILAIHGFLHLIGFDHLSESEAGKMKYLEKTIIEKFLSRNGNNNNNFKNSEKS